MPTSQFSCQILTIPEGLLCVGFFKGRAGKVSMNEYVAKVSKMVEITSSMRLSRTFL